MKALIIPIFFLMMLLGVIELLDPHNISQDEIQNVKNKIKSLNKYQTALG